MCTRDVVVKLAYNYKDKDNKKVVDKLNKIYSKRTLYTGVNYSRMFLIMFSICLIMSLAYELL